MGRAPKPIDQQRQRGRNLADKATVHLPIEGRFGRVLPWPLGKASKREAELWTKLWHTPQASMWERLGWSEVVARYARLLVIAEAPNPNFAAFQAIKEVRQMEDRLGLTPMAMLRLRWMIEPPEPTEQTGTVVDIRERLKAVDE